MTQIFSASHRETLVCARPPRGSGSASSIRSHPMSLLSSHADFAPRRDFRPARFLGSVHRLIRAVETAARWRQVINERRMLAGLDDRALHDFGVTRAEAIREAEKPFWR